MVQWQVLFEISAIKFLFLTEMFNENAELGSPFEVLIFF